MTPRIIVTVVVLFASPALANATEIGPPPRSPNPPEANAAQPSAPASSVRYRRAAPRVPTDDGLLTRVAEARRRAEEARANEQPTDLSELEQAERAARVEAAGMAITDAKIDKLRQLLRITAMEAPEYPDLLMRLADLHLEKKAYFERQAGALAQPIWDAEHGVSAPSSTPAVPSVTKPMSTTPAAATTGRSSDERPRRRIRTNRRRARD